MSILLTTRNMLPTQAYYLPRSVLLSSRLTVSDIAPPPWPSWNGSLIYPENSRIDTALPPPAPQSSFQCTDEHVLLFKWFLHTLIIQVYLHPILYLHLLSPQLPFLNIPSHSQYSYLHFSYVFSTSHFPSVTPPPSFFSGLPVYFMLDTPH